MACILLIEDDDDLRTGLAGVLAGAGHDVVEASDGRAGIDALAHERPDLMITDLVMEGMEGIETIREVRRRRPGMPVVAISGNEFYLENSRRLGADMALLKPFTKEQLIAAVSDLTTTNAA